MEVIYSKTIHGPNVFHNKSVVITRIDLHEYNDICSDERPEFTKKLVLNLPGLHEHTCSPGYKGGFIERLQRGTYLAHIIEHVALELSELAGIGVSYGKTTYAGATGKYDIVTRFLNEEGMKLCHQYAIEFVKKTLHDQEFNLISAVEEIKQTVARTKMGPSTQAIYDAACEVGIPCRRVSEHSLLRLGYGKNIRYVQAAVTDRTSNIAVELVQDKDLTKELLKSAGIPVPEGCLVRSSEEMAECVKSIQYPMVIKPYDGHHGQGVSLNLVNEQQALRAFELAYTFSNTILVEEMCQGRDYRVLVIDGKMVAAAERVPPFIIGDGVSTIEMLIAQLNDDPLRGEGHESILTKVTIDEALLQTLEKQQFLLTSILSENQKIFLRENANLSVGGTAKDVTDQVHPTVKFMCERIARLVGLDICGIDIIHPDIAKPATEGAKVIEVNAGPGLRMHLAPSEGLPRPVGKEIVKMLYKNPEESRIPIVSVTGTNGKTSTVRMLSKIMSSRYKNVGMTSSDGIWIGDQKIDSGDTSGPVSAAKVLNDPHVDCAVLEVARGGLFRGGLAYDWSDVGIITNIRADHIGQDGVEDMEDLIRIKSLVVERVRENGTIILNADDENASNLLTNKVVTKLKRNIILYSVEATNEIVLRHLQEGHQACWVEDGIIYFRNENKLEGLGSVHDLPVTMGGLAEFQISNALAALCGSIAAGIKPARAFQVLQNFNPIYENIGRINLYRIRDNFVILDYGHNPDAFVAIGKMLSPYKSYKKTAIVSLPGDRTDDLLKESARKFAGCFDRVVVKEDHHLRGRTSGEVPGLIEKLIKSEYESTKCEVILDEAQAIENTLNKISINEIVVIFYDHLEIALQSIRSFDPEPVLRIPEETADLLTAFNDNKYVSGENLRY